MEQGEFGDVIVMKIKIFESLQVKIDLLNVVIASLDHPQISKLVKHIY